MKAAPDTLIDLVKIYSPSGSEQAAVSYLVKRMQTLNFTQTFADGAGNAVGRMGNGPRQIVLLGHIDTVPGEIPVRVEPAGETDESDNLFGRGSVDAKGPLSAFVDAVAGCGPVPGWQFIVIGAVGEEADSPGAQYIRPLYRPEFAIIGEPSHWDRLTLGYKGSAWMILTVRRSLKHTAGQGESACEGAVGAWERLQSQAAVFNATRERAFDRLLLTLRGMDSGGDGFEEWATLRIGARLPLVTSPEKWYEQLRSDPVLSAIPGISIEPTGFPVPAYQGEKNTALVRAFLAGIREMGGSPGFVYKTGTADLNLVAPTWGCPAAAYGPGDSTLDHTPEEHLSLEEYQRAVDVLQAVLKRLSKSD